MKTDIKHICRVGTVIIILFCVGCTDSWEKHYEQASVGNSTLWEAISSRSELENFSKVLKACEYDLILDGSQTYSVFAPTDDFLSEVQVDSLIEIYQQQKSKGVKTDDNSVVVQFIHNHIALYRKSVSELTHDSITMMNGKYQILTENAISGHEFDLHNEPHSNGVLYTIDGQIAYFPNVLEYLGIDSDLDSVYNFINSYSVYQFDPNQSVAGGIVDGETVYLDSVEVFYNSFLNSFGKINVEDSTYWMVAPTNEEWSRLYTEYYDYFIYDKSVTKFDSMRETQAKQAIIRGAFFNRTDNLDNAFQDSAVSTLAPSKLLRSLMRPEDIYGVYYRPYDVGGVFSGTEEIVCSNGYIHKATQFNIDKSQTFLQTIKVEAENLTYQKSLLECETPLTVRDVPMDNPFYNKVSGNAYVDVIPKNTTDDPNKFPAPKVTFSIPSTLSNVGYDVYLVLAPVEAYNLYASNEDRLPNRIRGILNYCNIDGKTQTKRLSVVESTPGLVDTIQIAQNVKFPTCGYGLAEPVVSLQLLSQVTRDKTTVYSNTMHLDCIIFKPHVEE